jgi:PAS domain S-box-containing protein
MAESIVESSTETVLNVARTGTIKVLHVDDDQAFVKVAKQCLETQGEFEVDTASSVDEALEKLKKTDYDAVVSDYQMPGKDGLEFLKKLREKGNTVPFIVFTGKGREEVTIQALNLGADGYFNKFGHPETVYSELAHGMRQVVGKRRAEQSFLKSEDKYRRLVETLHEGIWAIDKDSRTTFVNPRMAEILGYDTEEMKGRHLFSFMDERGVEIAKRLLERRKQNIKEQHDFELLRKDGTRICAALETTPITDDNGNYSGALASVMDTTERKKAEEELKSSEQKFRCLVEESATYVGIIDLKGQFTYVNKALADSLGYSVQELTGRPFKDFLHPDDRGKIVRLFLKSTLLRRKLQSLEFRVIRKDGHVLRWMAKPTKFAIEGKTVGFQAIITDITERKKAEVELRNTKNYLDNLLNYANAPIIVWDNVKRITLFNNAFEALTGHKKKSMLGRNIDILFPPSQMDEILQTIEGATKGEKWKSVEIPILCKDKETKITLWNSANITDEEGKTVATIAQGQDITERRKAEEALRQSIESYKDLTESISDVFFAMDKGFRYTYWNKASEKLTGISAKDAIGKSLTEVFPDVKGTSVEQFYKEALRTQQHQSYLNKYQLKGKDYIFELNAYPTKTGLSVFVKDVTERKKTEEELKSSEQKFRGLVEDSAAAIATIDLKGRLTYMNKALADLSGYSIQEMSGRAFKDFVHPDDRGRLVRLFLKIIVLRRQPRKFEFRALRKDGAILHLTCRPTRLETAGKTVGFQAIIMDNTAEKMMLEKVEKMNEKLSVVGGLTRHDVNNKLSVILNVSFLLKQRLRDNQSLELVKETESAVHQIEGLFEFARTYEKLGTEELTWVDAEKVFNEAAMLFPSLQDTKIVNDCHGLTVFADSLLRQLFYNLIDNSLKHGEKVGQVRVHYETSEDRLKLIYEDDGMGIPKAGKDKIFKEGYGKDGGHGLYLIKKMCEVYGWTIQETGRQGKGAQFTINMPKAKPDGRPNDKLG